MSVTVDANVLIYATNEDDDVHAAAVALLRRLMAGPDVLYLFWPALMGFLRIATRRDVLPEPRSPVEAIENIRRWTAQPHVRTPGELAGFLAVYEATAGATTRGKDVPDAHLAALMRQHGVGTIYTRDRGFRRFDGIRAVDPFS